MMLDRVAFKNATSSIFLVSFACLFLVSLNSSAQSKRVLERTLLKANEQNYRYSESAVLNLDGNMDLLLVVSTFSNGGHDDSPAQLIAWQSKDGGMHFDPRTKFVFQANIGKKNVMSPSFLRLSRDEILFFFLITNGPADAGMWLRRSCDNGKTWSSPVRLPYDGYGGTANDHVIRLRTGRIVVPYWVSRDKLRSTHSFCFYSDDKGYSWKKSNEITVELQSIGRNTSPVAEEPAVIELKDGHLLMLMRTYVGSFYRSMSSDDGATWSEPENSGIPAPGSTPVLLRIPTTGDILLLYNYADPDEIKGPFPRTRIASAISRDEGDTFTSVRILDGSKSFPGKIMMPDITFVGRNAILFYSKSPSMKNEYSFVEQIVPTKWFYAGDRTKIYGQHAQRSRMSPRWTPN